MALNADDRTAVTELLSLHGHLFDAGELDRLDELFTDDAVYDVTDFGQEPLAGIAAIREASVKLCSRGNRCVLAGADGASRTPWPSLLAMHR
ncbi:nuclear transport factor 2 family protein [Streptomyces sp. NPDC093984]|uniref:nuclear transport factor 2 family protein n=1 Tax=Streptomyces sp. NPDC093984 TaxID=3366052 RepID=UPI003803AC16